MPVPCSCIYLVSSLPSMLISPLLGGMWLWQDLGHFGAATLVTLPAPEEVLVTALEAIKIPLRPNTVAMVRPGSVRVWFDALLDLNMFDHLFTLFHYSKLSPTICALGAARNSPALSRRKIAPLRPPRSVYLSYTNPRPLRPTNMGVLRNKSGVIFALIQSIKKFLFFPANFFNFRDLQGPVDTFWALLDPLEKTQDLAV